MSNEIRMTPQAEKILFLEVALQTMLDCVDYTSGNCKANEPVGGVLPKEIITKAKEALEKAGW